MFPILNTPMGRLDLYDILPILGAVVSVLVQMILLYRWKKKIRDLLFSALYGLYMWMGGYGSSFVRTLSLNGTESLKEVMDSVWSLHGKHFIGMVLMCAIWVVPCTKLLDRILHGKRDRQSYDDCFGTASDTLSIGLLIQHIFGRIGCICRGCCYGIPYHGIFSVVFPYGEVSYRVFPSQFLEIFLTVLLLFFDILWMHKAKRVFGRTLLGFSGIIFLSEFFMDKRGTRMFFGITVIQYFAIILAVVGILYGRYLRTKTPNYPHEVENTSFP